MCVYADVFLCVKVLTCKMFAFSSSVHKRMFPRHKAGFTAAQCFLSALKFFTSLCEAPRHHSFFFFKFTEVASGQGKDRGFCAEKEVTCGSSLSCGTSLFPRALGVEESAIWKYCS